MSNFDMLSMAGSFDNKKIEAMEDGVAPYDDFNSRIWNMRVKSFMLSNILRLLLLEGDILILDEIDTFLCKKDVLRICSILRDTEHLWNDIYVAGHDLDLVNASNDPTVHIWLKGRDEICVDMLQIDNYLHLI